MCSREGCGDPDFVGPPKDISLFAMQAARKVTEDADKAILDRIVTKHVAIRKNGITETVTFKKYEEAKAYMMYVTGQTVNTIDHDRNGNVTETLVDPYDDYEESSGAENARMFALGKVKDETRMSLSKLVPPTERILRGTALSRVIAALESNGGSMLLNGERVAGHSGSAGTVTRVTAATDPARAALRREKAASGLTGKQHRKFLKALRRDYKAAIQPATP